MRMCRVEKNPGKNGANYHENVQTVWCLFKASDFLNWLPQPRSHHSFSTSTPGRDLIIANTSYQGCLFFKISPLTIDFPLKIIYFPQIKENQPKNSI